MDDHSIKYGQRVRIARGVHFARWGDRIGTVRRVHILPDQTVVDVEIEQPGGKLVEVWSVRPMDCELDQ